MLWALSASIWRILGHVILKQFINSCDITRALPIKDSYMILIVTLILRPSMIKIKQSLPLISVQLLSIIPLLEVTLLYGRVKCEKPFLDQVRGLSIGSWLMQHVRRSGWLLGTVIKGQWIEVSYRDEISKQQLTLPQI